MRLALVGRAASPAGIGSEETWTAFAQMPAQPLLLGPLVRAFEVTEVLQGRHGKPDPKDWPRAWIGTGGGGSPVDAGAEIAEERRRR